MEYWGRLIIENQLHILYNIGGKHGGKAMINVLYRTYVLNCDTEEMEVKNHNISICKEVVKEVYNFLKSINKKHRLRELLLNGCYDIETVKSYLLDFPN